MSTRLGAQPFLHPDCEVANCQLGRYVELGQGTRLANTEFGDYSYTDRYADVANAVVGKFANIAAFSRIGPTDHPMHKASQHHFLYRSQDYFAGEGRDDQWFQVRDARVTHLGHDVWIGAQAIVKPEVSLGNGCIVASGAVVTRDVPAYTIVTGVPAQPLRQRFPDRVCADLDTLAWWDWSHEQLHTALPDFRAMEAADFVSKYLG